ncbi:rhodanese-like domain-containing protein [Lichtheimia corymbifera JMRC:FSU:9682]|uniref:Rhodanese-like domain-containing protein n=1 Tax=Lichtheimia corymbifera JMRC:FSU:9682 TaxID=1263082 RepID=A0A068RL80_9FUNG|nr:rhodanese-like domain-containing protein [Lichtheimia corymbifera JMRC:FSU:9682]
MLHRLGHPLFLVARNVSRTSTPRLVAKNVLPGVAVSTCRPVVGPALSILIGRSHIATVTMTKTTTATATATATCEETATPMPVQYRTLAFYKFHDLSQVDLAHFRQQLLDDLGRLDIVGRVYIAHEGINAQLSCPEWRIQELRTYCNQILKPKLGGQLMDLNFGTEDSAGPAAFRALHVRIRKQLVADGLDPKSYDLTNQPSHLSPAAWHEKLSKYKQTHGKDPILIDMRNHYESEIGYFEGAIRPNVDSFRGSVKSMNEICKDVPRDQEVFMYCTGGIRCSKAGAILQSASGFKKVHLVEGGITAYGRWIKEQQDKRTSLFKGRNFTFDKRMGEPITDQVLGKCHICGDPCNRYQNCSHASCNLLMLCCSKCASQFLNTCGRLQCYDVVHDFKTQASHYFNPEGPVIIDGVRAFIKKGESPEQDRIVIGKSGVKCEHDYHKRVRASDVLGEPGDVLKQWKAAGRELPPLSTKESA